MNSKESGQALPLGIALLFAGMITGVVLFNTGQVVSSKTRLANAADAAVYSGATWQARALNFNAYTNRSMVANQVAMAQAVSLQSWAQYARTTTDNLGTVLSPLPVIGQIAVAVQRVMRAFEPIINGFGSGMLAVVDPINSALSIAQEAMYLSAFVASPQIIGNVVSANDPKMRWETAFSVGQMGNNLRNWQAFTDQFQSNDTVAMDERVAMINASTDNFTRERSWEFFDRYLPLTPLHWARVDRSGATRLLRDRNTGETEWKAIDTLSLNNKFYYWFSRYRRVEIPIGYSLKYANNRENSIENCRALGNDCDDWFGRNRHAQYLARNVNHSLGGGTNTQKSDIAYRGVRAYRSLSASIRREDSATVLLRTELQLPTNELNDASSNNIAPNLVRPLNESSEAALSSVSSAEIYFNRPEDDAREEYATGYNPYWAVRLAPTTNAVRATALALRGSASSAVAVLGALAVYDGEGFVELPNPAGGDTNLSAWAPSMVGESASIIDSSVNSMGDVLTEVFDNVLAGLLGGVLPGGVESVNHLAQQTMAGVDMQDINTTVENVNSEIDEIRERFRAARETIQREFIAAAERLGTQSTARRQEINQQIETLRASLGNGDQEHRDEVNAEILRLEEERDGVDGPGGEGGLDQEFREQLALALIDIVYSVLPEWPIPFAQALSVVDQYLEFGNDVSDQLNVIELSISEDNLNE